MNTEAQRAFEASLASDLRALAVPAVTASRGTQATSSWDLPHEDKMAILRLGIPTYEPDATSAGVQLSGSVQYGIPPEIDEDGIRAYALGRYWRRRLGAVVHDGIVVGVPDDRSLKVSYVNSSVSAFIEIAWRWHYARKALLAITDDHERLYGNLARFEEFAHRRDNALSNDPRYAWWNGIIEGW